MQELYAQVTLNPQQLRETPTQKKTELSAIVTKDERESTYGIVSPCIVVSVELKNNVYVRNVIRRSIWTFGIEIIYRFSILFF